MNKVFRYLDVALFAYVGAMAILLSLTSPVLNWDVIGYVGAAKVLGEPDTTAVHSFTFQTLQASVPPASFQSLISPPYPSAIYSDPRAFSEQLPFYQTRIGYTWLIQLLSLTGVSMVTATHLTSAIAVTAGLALLFGMSRTFIAPKLRIVIPLAALAFGFTDIARASTPDGLALFALIGCSLLYLKNEASVLVRLLPLLGFIRTDLSLFSLLMLAALLKHPAVPRRQLAVAFAATITICLGLESAFRHPGWATTLYVTLVQAVPYPLSQPPALTPEVYAHKLVEGLRGLAHEDAFLVYAALTLCGTLLLRKLTKGVKATPSPSSQLEVMCASYIALHFIALPVTWERFFAGPYIMGVFALLAMLTERRRALARTPERMPQNQQKQPVE